MFILLIVNYIIAIPPYNEQVKICNQIEKILNSDLPIEEAVVKLIKKSNSRGGTDNITIAYLKKESGDL